MVSHEIPVTNTKQSEAGRPCAQTPACREFVKWRDFLLQHRTDYATAYEHFEWPRLNSFNWALDYFDYMAAGNTRPGLQIVSDSGVEATTFAALVERSNQAANYLRRIGVGRFDRILVMLGNEQSLWVATLAAIKLGAVLIPTSLLLTADDLRDRLARGDVRHIVTSREQIEKFSTFDAGITRICTGFAYGWWNFSDYMQESKDFESGGITGVHDPLFLYFTSGTTAQPKLVMHSHLSYPVGSLSTMYWLGVMPGDVHLNISSPGWGKHAWSSFFAPWNAGATVMSLNQPRFNARGLLSVLRDNPVTTFCAPPTVWRMIVQERFTDQPIHLREIVSAGEVVNPEVVEKIRAGWRLPLRDGYGQTETTAQIGTPPGEAIHSNVTGLPLPGFSIHVLNEQDRSATEGDVAISLEPRPAGLMLGYVQSDGTISRPEGRFYRTGDLAITDDSGRVTITGRADDVFKSSDYRISPFEIENILMEHEAVAEAAVVPSPDPIRTTVPKAFIKLVAGCLPNADLARELFAHVSERISPFKRLRKLEFSDLPKTASGKILRSELRKAELSGPASPTEFRESDLIKIVTIPSRHVSKGEAKMNQESNIIFEERTEAYWLRLNRPAAMNAFDQDTLVEWNAALRSIEERHKPLVITGTGKAFCAGGDLKKYLRRLDDLEGLRSYFDLLEEVFMQIVEYPGPTIAAINGVAVAGGIEIVCVCDLAVAADSARLADGHINYGLHPAGGSSATLRWLIGDRRAKWLLLTGEFISANEGERIGLVNRVVPDDALGAEVKLLAETLGRHSRDSISTIKKLTMRDLRPVLRSEKVAILEHFQKPETKARLEGFAKKNEATKAKP